ncbi:MAG: hypothetical protein PHY82_07955 [Lentisphaeria bacterium]|nr:hypothetical protein [Lentisphaeria bacterium]
MSVIFVQEANDPQPFLSARRTHGRLQKMMKRQHKQKTKTKYFPYLP